MRDLTGKPLQARVFERTTRKSFGRRSHLSQFGEQRCGIPEFVDGHFRFAAPRPRRLLIVRRKHRRARVRSSCPSNVQWTNTGINVGRGQSLRFEPSGEVRLSFNGDDIARPAGALSNRHSGSAPIPTIPAGALIGRINNGQPFSIGDPTQAIQMPENGRLFLGVNDDHAGDNSGNYVVRIWEP